VLSLADAVTLAADTAPAVTLARLEVEEARARTGQASAYIIPVIDGVASWNRRTFNLRSLGLSFPTPPGQPPPPTKVGPVDVYDARFRATGTFFDPASRVRVRAARAEASAREEEAGDAAEAAAERAARAYTAAARAAASARARAADLRVAEELLAVARAQLAQGVGTELDVTRARTQAAIAREQLEIAETDRAQAELELARALGMDPAVRIALSSPLSPWLGVSDAPRERDTAVALALARHAGYRAALARVQAARATLRAVGAERLPRVDASADYGLNGPDVDQTIRTYQVGVQVTVPVLDVRRTRRAEEQAAVLREAEVRAADLRRQVAADVESALLDLASGASRETIAAERMELAQEELHQARRRFEEGVASNLEVINAQSNLVRARDAVIEAQSASATARIRLARATGVATSLH
jgi:outer membrane protein TolC